MHHSLTACAAISSFSPQFIHLLNHSFCPIGEYPAQIIPDLEDYLLTFHGNPLNLHMGEPLSSLFFRKPFTNMNITIIEQLCLDEVCVHEDDPNPEELTFEIINAHLRTFRPVPPSPHTLSLPSPSFFHDCLAGYEIPFISPVLDIIMIVSPHYL
jgi:hypothetical protein